MTLRKNAGLLALALCALLAIVTNGDRCLAQPAEDDKGWSRLDEADTSHATTDLNKSEFTVKEQDKNEGFTKIRIRNHGPTVRFTAVYIQYDHDDVQKVEMDKVAENNEGTGAINLSGKAREIKKVVAVYRVVGHHRAAGKLALWGFKPTAG